MARPRSYIRDNAGNVVPVGQVKRVLEENFLLGSQAAWLSCTGGTQTFSAPSAGYGYTQIASGSTTGNSAQLSGPTIDTSSKEAILWEVEGLTFDVSGAAMDITLGVNAAGQVGAYAKQASGSANFVMNSGSSAFTATNYQIRDGGEGIHRHNIGLWLFPPAKEVLLLQNGQVVGYRDGTVASSWTDGVATPNITITTQAAAARTMFIEQVRLTVWTN